MPDPPAPNSAVEIVNSALLKLGLDAITDFDENTKPARTAKATYAQIRNDVLASFPWKFALRRSILAPTALPEGSWGYEFAYSLPIADFLSVHAVEDQSAQDNEDWTVEGDILLTNLGDPLVGLKVIFITEVEDVGLYTAGFVEHLTERLMAEWIESLRGVTNLSEQKILTSEEKRRRAFSTDGRQATPKRQTAFTFINAR